LCSTIDTLPKSFRVKINFFKNLKHYHIGGILLNRLNLSAYIVTITALVGYLFFAVNGYAAEQEKVLILPFKIHSQENISYLQEGIHDMLSSRLAHEDKVVFISEEKVQNAIKNQGLPQTERAAITLGKSLAADYVVLGSLTILGDNISTDGKLIDIRKGKSMVNFNRLGTNSSEIINHVDQFAAEINQKVFNMTPSTHQPPFTPTPAADAHRHPEKLIPQKAPENKTSAIRMALGDRWLSQRFNIEIRDLALGDVDGDGQTEIVIMERHGLKIFRFGDDRLVKIGELEEKSYNTFLNLGIADINGNGRSEIYVTNKPQKNYNSPISFVVEKDGKGLRKIAAKQPWYFRVIKIPGQGKALFGQKPGLTTSLSEVNNLFERSVYRLKWNGDNLEKGKPYDLPYGVDIFDFSVGDVFNDGRKMIVAATRTYQIKVYNPDKKEEWESSDPFGSTNNYIEYANQGDRTDMLRSYLPHPAMIVNTDNNGSKGLVAVNNNENLKGFSRIKIFKDADIECLQWDGLNFKTKWQTEKVTNLIGGYDLADADHDGRVDLVYAVVGQTSLAYGRKGQSKLVIQQLGK
jgi:TolB-like protein